METNTFLLPREKGSIYAQLFVTFYGIAVGRRRYDGREDTDIGIDDIERSLMYSGLCCLYKENGKLVARPCVGVKWNAMGRPIVVQPYSFMPNGDIKELAQKLKVGTDCAIILNNVDMTPTFALLAPYLKRLSDIWREMGNNLALSRVFAIMQGNTDGKIANAFKKMIEKGYAVVETSDTMAMLKSIEKWDFKIEYRQSEYHGDFDATFQMALAIIGINNAGYEKKERLIVDEVNANNKFLELVIHSEKDYREEGIKQANKLFGTNLRVIDYCDENIHKEQDNGKRNEDGKERGEKPPENGETPS